MKAFTLPTIFTAVNKFTSVVSTMSNSLSKFSAKAQAVQKKVNTAFTSLGGNYLVPAVVAGLGAVGYAIKKVINEASKIENAESFYTPLMGSTARATELVRRLTEEAATTPFVFEDISKTAGSLLPVMNGDIDSVIKSFRFLGDTAGGNVDKLNRVTLGYTKALLKGKVTLESLNIIAEAGVPIFAQMAKSMNLGEGVKGTAKLFKLITKGKVSTEALTKTFEMMTSEGGIFFQGMVISSKTFTGVMSTLEDNISMTAASIGKELLPYAKDFALQAIKVTDNIRAWVSQNKELIASKFKEFMKGAVSFAQKLWVAAKFIWENWEKIVFWFKIYIGLLVVLKAVSIGITIATTATLLLEGATTALTAAQWLLNAAMMANPIGLMIAGIVLLIAVVVLIVKYYEQWGAAANLVLAIFLPGLALVIGLVMSFRKNWERITTAFRQGGILEGIKAIGSTLLDIVLQPLEQILSIIADITGFDWAANASKSINKFRADMGVTMVGEDRTIQDKRENYVSLINPHEEREKQLERQSVFFGKSMLQMDINTPQGTTASVKEKTGIPIKLGSTHEFGK